MRTEFFAMALESESRWPVERRMDEASPAAGAPCLGDTILELAMTSGGIVGVIVLIFAGLRLFGYR
jgi:hypothetical protein